MKVVKFGGSSVANAEQISKIIDIVTMDADRRIVVVSAPGKRYGEDTKVTDLLIALAHQVLGGADYEAALQEVVDRYAEIQKDLNLPESVVSTIEADPRSRIENRGANDLQFMDTMKASGEDNNAKVIAEAFTNAGHPAIYVNPGDAGMLLSVKLVGIFIVGLLIAGLFFRRAQREREQLAGERSFRMSIVIATLAVTALFLLLLFLRFA